MPTNAATATATKAGGPRAAGDPDDGLGDDGQHGGRQAGEQGGDHYGVPGRDVDRGQHEQCAIAKRRTSTDPEGGGRGMLTP